MMLEILFMKNVVSFWEKRSNYEKAILGLFAAFALCCLGYFGGRLYYGSQCAVCNQELRIGEHYILDVRTGEILCPDRSNRQPGIVPGMHRAWARIF